MSVIARRSSRDDEAIQSPMVDERGLLRLRRLAMTEEHHFAAGKITNNTRGSYK